MKHEKIYCPYCGPWNGHPEGVEMEDVFYYFECPICKSRTPNVLWDKTSHAVGAEEKRRRARHYALQRFTPPQKPLTLNELREMNGEPVWCEEIECWGIVSCPRAGRYKGIPFFTSESFDLDIAKRGLTIYKAKPESAKDSGEDQEA